ncbi:DUF1824 family protein [Gloeobacter morelensis]|uniref:DUF1824 family protein n=1 Tax=Gloeobacter morelensis MG652769 TaxID=2781736 RepID=A0ABY3PKC0_9CYAN|nr:DUF1824 family protein [Gloeobacter morelensis]UFP94115.1 DUF1824 family protein [Gloeobacter morelensis MG652769]
MESPELNDKQAQRILENSAFADRALVRRALVQLAGPAEYKMIGICADSVESAVTALRGYLAAFDYPEPPLAFDPIDERGVYLKFNPKTGSCYVSPYTGSERGVIVSCFSPGSEEYNETYAHLPMELFTRTD